MEERVLVTGTPVIASDLPGPADAVAGGEGRERMGRVAATRAEEHSVAAVGKRYVELLHELAGR